MYKEAWLIKILLRGCKQKYLKMISLNLNNSGQPMPWSWWLSYRNAARGTNPGGKKDFRQWQSHTCLGLEPTGHVSQAPHPFSPSAQGPQKQSCYKTVFEKGFSGPMGQLKRFPFTHVKGLWPFLHLQVSVGTHIHTHTHVHTREGSSHHKLPQTESVSNYPLEYFPLLPKFFFRSRLCSES